MIAVDLSKQQALDADPRAIQQINFTANLDRAGNTSVIISLLVTCYCKLYKSTLFSKKQKKLF